jgi:hypothetical protein
MSFGVSFHEYCLNFEYKDYSNIGCAVCSDGHYLDLDGVCQTCFDNEDHGCSLCVKDKCLACQSGWFMSFSGACINERESLS